MHEKFYFLSLFSSNTITDTKFILVTLLMLAYIQGGSVCAPFTGTAYRLIYFKPILKEINQDTSTKTKDVGFFFHFTMDIWIYPYMHFV